MEAAETIEKIIGERVKSRRDSLGLTQTDLAKGAKVSLTTINRLENGRQVPQPKNMAAILVALETTAEKLLFGAGVTTKEITKEELLAAIRPQSLPHGIDLAAASTDQLEAIRGILVAKPDRIEAILGILKATDIVVSTVVRNLQVDVDNFVLPEANPGSVPAPVRSRKGV